MKLPPAFSDYTMEKDKILEPEFWDFNKDGLFCGWYERKPSEKNCIDKALRKLYGKDAFKPTKATRWDFRRK